ncbi:MAG: esterase-like activity of phytase family protein [Candidatus Hydrogenedentales bacterium]|jgi:uncharacterized protein YjiK
MRFLVRASFLLALMGAPSLLAQTHVDIPELPLDAVYSVDASDGVEPSGLAFYKDELYCVSDKHDSCVYRIRMENERATLDPAISFELPNDGPEGLADFEGLCCDSDGNFYLASEKMFRVLRVPPDGKGTTWVTPDLRPAGAEAGLFRTEGAYVEGLARIDATHFVLCAERQPRGIVSVDLAQNPPTVQAVAVKTATIPPHGIRVPDFTDLCYHDGVLYALERNAEIISMVETKDGAVSVRPWRSFRDAVNRKDLRYADRRFGMAEGLAIHGDRVYVILDNNQDARADGANDKRPLLFVFRNAR